MSDTPNLIRVVYKPARGLWDEMRVTDAAGNRIDGVSSVTFAHGVGRRPVLTLTFDAAHVEYEGPVTNRAYDVPADGKARAFDLDGGPVGRPLPWASPGAYVPPADTDRLA